MKVCNEQLELPDLWEMPTKAYVWCLVSDIWRPFVEKNTLHFLLRLENNFLYYLRKTTKKGTKDEKYKTPGRISLYFFNREGYNIKIQILAWGHFFLWLKTPWFFIPWNDAVSDAALHPLFPPESKLRYRLFFWRKLL